MVHSAMIQMAALAVMTAAVAPAFAGETDQLPAPTEQAVAEVSGTISLADVVALTLERSPDLASFSWDIRAAEARQIQARLRPNPELLLAIEDVRLGSGPGTRTTETALGLSGAAASVQAERARESGAGSGFREAEFTISLAQLIELGGKRAKRIELAARDRDVAAWDYEVARADVLLNAAQAFVAVLAARERLALDNELVQLAQQELDTVSARVKAGRVSPLEATRAQSTLSIARAEANASVGRLESARSALAATWGDTEPRFERAEGRLDVIRAVPPLDELRGRIRSNPELARWHAELEKREAAIAVERANAAPDVTVQAGFRALGTPEGDAQGFGLGSDGVSVFKANSRSDSRWENSVVLGVSVPLPLFNRNQGSILEAERLASKGGDQRRAASVQAHARLARAYQQLSTAYAAILSLRDTILPAATEILESVTNAYKQGKVGYLDVLDAQRTLFQARQQYLDSLAGYHQSVAEIERTIGEPIWKEEK